MTTERGISLLVVVGWDREKGLEPMEPWADWDPVMQEDYLAEIDLTVGDQLVMEIRRKVLDTTTHDDEPVKR